MGGKIQEFSGELKRRFIHYGGQSTIELYEASPGMAPEILEYTHDAANILSRREAGENVDIKPLRARLDALNEKYSQPWKLDIGAPGEAPRSVG